MTETAYDREWTTATDLPDGCRLRMAYTAEAGTPIRFLVQLEHRHESTWRVVARFDHDRSGPIYRDVERSGLHLDLYDPAGTQREMVRGFPPEAPAAAMEFAERYLRQRAERLVRRFIRWQ